MAQLPKVAWIAIAGLAGCGSNVGEPGPTRAPGSRTASQDPPAASTSHTGGATPVVEPAAALAAVDENLARLRALDVFEVGDLIVQMPMEALNCYGPKPCAGSEPAVASARADAAVRLATFADALENAAVNPSDSYACDQNIDVNLEALRTLQVVEVGSFILSEAPNDPNCYNAPCAEAVTAAAAANHERAAKLESMATSVPEL